MSSEAWQTFRETNIINTNDKLVGMIEDVVTAIAALQTIDNDLYRLSVNSLRHEWVALSRIADARGIQHYPSLPTYQHNTEIDQLRIKLQDSEREVSTLRRQLEDYSRKVGDLITSTVENATRTLEERIRELQQRNPEQAFRYRYPTHTQSPPLDPPTTEEGKDQ